MQRIASAAFGRANQYQLFGRTITVKVKFTDFRIITRSTSFEHPITDENDAYLVAKALIEDAEFEGKLVRLIGVGFSNFHEPRVRNKIEEQKELF